MTREIIEASQLGLKPGIWPPIIDRLGTLWHRAQWLNTQANQLHSVLYKDSLGRELEVLND